MRLTKASYKFSDDHREEMTSIYFYDWHGKKVNVEVSKELREAYLDLIRQWMRNESYHRYHTVSLDAILDAGHEFMSESESNPLEYLVSLEENKEREVLTGKLKQAIKQISPKQQNLLRQIYWKNLTQVAVAKKEGVSQSAISERLKRIRRRLKKTIEKME